MDGAAAAVEEVTSAAVRDSLDDLDLDSLNAR